MAPPWHLLLLVAVAVAVKCPDGRSCGAEMVCCSLADGDGYGCCTKEVKVTRSLPMITTEVPCTEWAGCPEEYSCVSTPRGVSSCCPLAEGASCQDGHHCCPSGSTCSEDGHFCVPVVHQSAIICPDGASECPSDTTCCQMSDQRWGCCPLQQAVCCTDHVHCCPQNTVCDLVHGTCTSKNGEVPMSKKLPARMRLLPTDTRENDGRSKCHDGSSCPDGSTCCDMGEHSFGCCPLISAVCCGDHKHCCPSGTTCDLIHLKCLSKDSETPMYTKTPSLREEASVRCNDTVSCPASNTCCRLSSGDWGCCPYENAVCCPDREYCCPNGFTCGASGCMKDETSIPWFKKTPALKDKTSVRCNDTASCYGLSTCCRLSSGEWGCCPYENAVCCPDHVHCCPNGFTCGGSGCTQDETSIPWLKKTPALKDKSTDVPCDPTTYCPDGNTCCRLPSGDWGCCPIVKAVCCPDHLHCCPSGWRCDDQGDCILGHFSIPWLTKTVANTRIKCDQSHSCSQGTTCCRTEGGGWACCPLEEAVCCEDHEHCCPTGYTCDVTTATCNKPGEDKSVETVTPINPVDVVWCDSGHYCYDGQTCCLGPGGYWTCCPYTLGVCCPDRVHCCPHGYICLAGGAQCSRSGGPEWDLGWMKMKPAL